MSKSSKVLSVGVATTLGVGAIFDVKSMHLIKPGYVGVVYNLNGGIQEEMSK